MYIGRVASPQALNVTGGRWSSSTEPLSPGAHEFPPDASLELRFGSPVQLAMLEAALIIRKQDEAQQDEGQLTSHTARLAACRTPSERCALVRIEPPLEVGAVYDLVLPAASRVDPSSGPTRSEHSVRLTGLVPFSIPFLHTATPFTVGYRRLRLWIRHGLPPGSDADDLRPFLHLRALSVGTSGRPPSALTSVAITSVSLLSASVVELAAPLEPSTSYTLTVDADPSAFFVDGFGLILQPSSTTFKTRSVPSLFLLPGGSVSSGPTAVRLSSHNASALAALEHWPALVRGDSLCVEKGTRVSRCWAHGGTAQSVRFAPVTEQGVGAAIASLHSRNPPRVSSSPAAVVNGEGAGDDAEVRRALLGTSSMRHNAPEKTGLMLQTTFGVHGYSSGDLGARSALLSAGSLGATTAALPDRLLVWVLNASTGEPLPGAAVRLHTSACPRGRSCYSSMIPSDVVLLDTRGADAEGIVAFPLSSLAPPSSTHVSRAYHIEVSAPTTLESADATPQILLLPSVPAPPPPPLAGPPLIATLVPDRSVYKPSDVVRVVGYVRTSNGRGGLLIPPLEELEASTYEVHVAWGMSTSLTVTVAATLDKTYGTLHASVSVPAGALYRKHTLSLRRIAAGRAHSLAHAVVAVADPRPPTVEMDASLAEGCRLPPNGSVPIRIRTTTLSGVPLRGQRVTMRWAIQRGSTHARPPATNPIDGVAWQRRLSLAPPRGEGGDVGVSASEDDDGEQDVGETIFETSDDGTATLAWRPTRGGLPISLSPGDTIDGAFEYLGPTRERITASLTIPVATQDYSLSLQVPPVAQLPHHTFDLALHLAALPSLGGALIGGVPLRVTLHALPQPPHRTTHRTSAPAPYGGAGDGWDGLSHGDTWGEDIPPDWLPPILHDSLPIATCELTSAAPHVSTHECGTRLALRTLGQYLAVACALDGSTREPTLCSAVVLGRSAAQWDASPLVDYLSLAVSPSLERPSYALGEAPTILLTNPGSKPLRAMASWGNELASAYATSEALPPGDVSFQLPPLDDDCLNGCSLTVTLLAPADADRAVLVPTSPLFDVRGPLLARHTLTIDVPPPPPPLAVTLNVGAPVAAPGQPASVTIELRDAMGQPVEGQVALFGVDRALLAVRPHPVANLSADLTPRVPPSYARTADSYASLIASGGVRYMEEVLTSALLADPWLPVSWPVHPTGGMEQERGVAAMLASHASSLTPMPALSRDDHLQTRGGSGRAVVPWTLPENTGAFELRAYATTAAGQLGGGATAIQHVRKRVTLEASVPRVARVGDAFECGVTITGAPELPSSSNLVLELGVRSPSGPTHAALALTGPTEVTISLGPSEVREVLFSMNATAVGEATLVAIVREIPHAGGAGATDGLELQVPVVGLQPPVTIATSMGLHAEADFPRLWAEGLLLPPALPGSTNLSIGATAGRLAAVEAIAKGLQRLPTWHDQPNAPSLLAAAASAAMLAPYAAADGGVSAGAVHHSLGVLANATAALDAMSDGVRGLHFSSSSLSRGGEAVDLRLNALGLLVVRRLVLSGVGLPETLRTLSADWRRALSTGLTTFATEAILRYGEWADYETLALSYLGLGTGWRAPSTASLAVHSALSLAGLGRAVDRLSIRAKAAYALSRMLPAEPSDDSRGSHAYGGVDEHVQAVVAYLSSCLRVSGRTAYLAASSSSRAAAPDADTSLALSALSLAKTLGAPPSTVANLDKLAAHVASGGFGGAAWSGLGGASLYDGLALVDYDAASDSLAADVRLQAIVSSTPTLLLYDAHLEPSSGTGHPPTKAVPWPAPSPPAPSPPLVFVASGRGEASIALTLDFTPSTLPAAGVSRGLRVAKILRRLDPVSDTAVGPPLAAIGAGSVVTVTLEVTSADELTSLVIDDWLPAGLEPIDPLANGGADDGADGGRGGGLDMRLWGWGGGCWGWWRCTSWARETRKDRVSFYASWAHAGTHTLSYEAIAVTRGDFGLPPTKAYAALQPEVMGLSAGGGLRVSNVGDAPQYVSQDSAAATPHECLTDCSGRGTCDATTGRCACVPGAVGDDCSLVASIPTLEPVNEDDTVALDTAALDTPVLDGARGSQDAIPPIRIPVVMSSPHAGRPPPSAHLLSHLLALSSDEAALPSSTLSLSVAGHTALELAISSLYPPAHSTCVRVMVAASSDGVLYGSRTIALWLSAAATAPPHDCSGDGLRAAPGGAVGLDGTGDGIGDASLDADSTLVLHLASPALAGSQQTLLGVSVGLGVLGLLLAALLVRRARAKRSLRFHHFCPESPRLGRYPALGVDETSTTMSSLSASEVEDVELHVLKEDTSLYGKEAGWSPSTKIY